MKQIFTLFLVLLATVLTSCRGIQFRQDENYNYTTITFTEEQAADLIEGLLTGGSRPIMRSATAELYTDEIYVTGEVNDGNGDSFPGALSISVDVVDGNLLVSVTSFSFAGYTADQAMIDDINASIAEGFAASAERDDNPSDFTEFTITGSSISFTIRSPREG